MADNSYSVRLFELAKLDSNNVCKKQLRGTLATTIDGQRLGYQYVVQVKK